MSERERRTWNVSSEQKLTILPRRRGTMCWPAAWQSSQQALRFTSRTWFWCLFCAMYWDCAGCTREYIRGGASARIDDQGSVGVLWSVRTVRVDDIGRAMIVGHRQAGRQVDTGAPHSRRRQCASCVVRHAVPREGNYAWQAWAIDGCSNARQGQARRDGEMSEGGAPTRPRGVGTVACTGDGRGMRRGCVRRENVSDRRGDVARRHKERARTSSQSCSLKDTAGALRWMPAQLTSTWMSPPMRSTARGKRARTAARSARSQSTVATVRPRAATAL